MKRVVHHRTNAGFGSIQNNTADVSLSLTHPLLRGGDGFAKSAVELAVLDSDLAALDAETATALALEAVITAYWNLIFTVQDVATRVLGWNIGLTSIAGFNLDVTSMGALNLEFSFIGGVEYDIDDRVDITSGSNRLAYTAGNRRTTIDVRIREAHLVKVPLRTDSYAARGTDGTIVH